MRRVHLPLRQMARPEPGKVQVWLAHLPDFQLPGLAAPRTLREHTLDRRVRQQFLLRLILAACLGCRGRDLRIERAASGKPQLVGGGPRFNLSHSGEWLAVALAEAPVGVDIEYRRPIPRAVRLARRYFDPSEAAWLAGFDEPRRSAEFLRFWTAKEALIKTASASVAKNLATLVLNAGERLRIKAVPPGWPTDWGLAELQAPEDLIGHVALEGELKSFDLARLMPGSEPAGLEPE